MNRKIIQIGCDPALITFPFINSLPIERKRFVLNILHEHMENDVFFWCCLLSTLRSYRGSRSLPNVIKNHATQIIQYQ